MEGYMLRLALQGELAVGDVLHFERDQLFRTYNLFASSERALADTNVVLERKVVELEAANRVLQQRTEALVSLHDIGQALIDSAGDAPAAGLGELALRVCRHTRDLCGADRAVLYLARPENVVEVLAVHGWSPNLVRLQLDASAAFPASREEWAGESRPVPFTRLPPGVEPRDAQGVSLRSGLCVPLVAQRERVGWMIVHTTRGSPFSPGEVALLQTYANQAAMAIQRAGLVESLWLKIEELEAAQEQLAYKERLVRELELARQVQQSVLPRTFPQVPGYTFAALNEPARQVGGDFYDVIRLDEEHFGLAVADVSDKGMPAAVYMALTRSLLLAEARRDLSPRAVLESVNRLLLELGPPGGTPAFVSLFYGVVEAAARRLTYARAGHDRPLLLRDTSVLSLQGEGTVLGVLGSGQLRLSEEQIVLAPGDRLVLFTDGLTDVVAPDERMFDLERLKALLQSCAGVPAEELCRAVFERLGAFRGAAEQYDDMTMLVMQVAGA
jgi:serine phosphatase RsbU (regulator of sigma subunit)